MLKKLQQHWKVNPTDLVFILLTFAVTGTFTAWVSEEITNWLSVEKYSLGWWFLKILVLLFGYQVFLLFFGFCFGQFSFFWKFEKKFLRKLGILKREGVTIAIFASGTGTNTARIIEYFKKHSYIHVGMVVTNNPQAGVIQVAENAGIPLMVINKDSFQNPVFIEHLQEKNIHWIILAGFLWKIPPALIKAFPDRILNIHPALLPRFGGHGMYGARVHEAVLKQGEKNSGITIHYVDEVYDNGKIIHQSTCEVSEKDDPASLAARVHALEHEHYPAVIEKEIKKQTAR